MWIVVMASIASLVLYRVVAAWKVWELSALDEDIQLHGGIGGQSTYARQRRWRVFKQLWDVEMLNILHLSHVAGISGDSAPQRTVSLMEAVLESAPQVCSLSVLYLTVSVYVYTLCF